jgi:hypothetical protein
VVTSDLAARLAGLASSGRLVERDLAIALRVESRIGWKTVHAEVVRALGESATSSQTQTEARAAIDQALASVALSDARAAMTPEETQAFADLAMATLFGRNLASSELHLVASPPSGDVVYHKEQLERAM